MTAMGFWHGAAGHYLFWGFLQGAALSFFAFFPNFKNFILATRLRWFLSWLATFVFVAFAWIFFRVESIGDGFAMIGQLFSFQRLDESFKLYALAAIIIGFVFLTFEKKIITGLVKFGQKLPLVIWFAFVSVAVALLFRAGSDTLPAFIYFNF
jgi:alginate O-acetyltransferase complex protein AlgI